MENLERIQIDLEDAKKAWIDTAMENRMVIPEPEELSMNQYCTMLLSMNDNAIHEYRYRKQ